ncbi:hypothetical protein CAPN001_11740 [Capnocytophaga stomatis]|uniref:hypothetical protein n=1 Tax=Capnocytophaga stomatis TaxID=1848904 RepID=UPI00194ED3B7|nr:hypothetical protein [Capnocytophaga stomatis]GIJ96605.1 hypothetical protein CAPN001_11740 [Capnocytophaga stomatis]
MILTEKHFEQIRDNIEFEYDVFTGIFNIKALTPFFEFNAYYEEKDVINNQYVISPLKIKFEFYSEIIPEEIELSGVQKKEVAHFLKELYEGEYLEAKEEFLNELRREENAPLFSARQLEEAKMRNSYWLYN